MSITINRRWFILGAASAVAVAVVPSPVQMVERVAAQHTYRTRRIFDILCSFDGAQTPDEDASNLDEIATIRIKRNLVTPLLNGILDESYLFGIQLNVRSQMRWVATPGDEIVVPEHNTLSIVVDAQTAVGRIAMLCRDKIDDGPEVEVCEAYTFHKNKPRETQLAFFWQDNSLAARIARQDSRVHIHGEDDEANTDRDE